MELVSRKEAIALGRKTYFDGKPCPKGHVAQRRISSYGCTRCEYDSCKARQERDRESTNTYAREWRARNPEKFRAALLASYYRHLDSRKASHKEWKERNPRYHVEYNSRQYHDNIQKKLKILLGTRVHKALKRRKKVGSAVKDLGCTVEFLKGYLEAQFSPGMTWQNHGAEWQIDHVKALCSFDLTDRAQFLAACHYSNLQPLWNADHSIKSGRDRRGIV
jgi:hypothetical protein